MTDALDSGNLTVAYHVNDLVRSITRAGLSKTYTLDVDQQRIRSWTEGGVTHTNHYDGDGDNPSWTQESPDPSATWTRNIGGIAGDLVGIYDSATNATSMQLTNLHGDVVAAASTSSTAASPTAQFEADEFGVPRGATGRRYGWLGGKQRAADTPGGLSLMGVRLYNPSTGRFLQVDPVWGAAPTRTTTPCRTRSTSSTSTAASPWTTTVAPLRASARGTTSRTRSQRSAAGGAATRARLPRSSR